MSFADLVTVPKREKDYNEKENIHYTLTVKWRKSENHMKGWWNNQKGVRKTITKTKDNERNYAKWKKIKKKVTCRKDTVRARKLPYKDYRGVQSCEI